MEKLKTGLGRAAGGIAFIMILVFMVLRLNSAFLLLQEDNLCARYYKYPKDTFDVVFLGASFSLYGIYPMELYRDRGIASYNLSTGNQSIEASYYLAKEAIERDHPSLIVLDCNMAWTGQETMKPQYIHYITDTMPYLSKNRVEMVKNLAEEGEDLKSYLLPLIAYHSKWQERSLEETDPKAKELLYGGRVSGRVEAAEPFEEPGAVKVNLPETSVKYLQKMIDLCRESDTQLLLITVPVLGENKFFSQSGYDLRWNSSQEVGKIAAQNNVPFLDCFAKWEELGFDPERDAFDGEHINRWGAARFTGYLGEYLKNNYDLPDRRGTGGAYDVIDKDAEKYPVSRMRASLRSSVCWQDYAATLCSDATGAGDGPVKDALVLIALNGPVDDTILTAEQAALLKDLGLKQDLRELEGFSWLAVIDGGEVLYETVPGKEDSADSFEGDAGSLHYIVTSGEDDEETGKIRSGASIKVDRLEYASDNRGLHFAVFDKSEGKLMDACRLNIHSPELPITHDNN